ncbi:diguanylate cyclase [Candidatus Halobeggiatoa sp. HSG11]|nr:diguanylate cyclase [Candidatus Halobeggiatoa sp. HSG11]
MSIRFKLGFLLTVLFLAAIGNTIFTFILDSYGEEKLTWVLHTHEVLTESERLLGAMTDAETGQRGYLLTQDSEYLEPYHIGVSKSKNHLNTLLRLTLDNKNQQKRLKNINALIKKKFDELAHTIDLTQQNTEDSLLKAAAIVKNNTGKKYMDTIRLEIFSFKNEELLLLEQRKGEFKESRAYIAAMVGFELLFFIFMSIFTGVFIKNKLYQPLEMLINGTDKMEKGEKQDISDILPNDEMGYLLSRFYRMSETVRAKTKALSYEASHDALTGLKNRAGLEAEIDESIRALNENQKLAVLFIDLNKFKKLNDSLGHDVGDAVLEETSKRLKNSIRNDDAVYRLGGDEFVVIIKNLTQVTHANLVVENILKTFSKPFVFQDHTITISLSIGISISPDNSSDSNKILKLSDMAMYAAKRDDSVNYKFFDT